MPIVETISRWSQPRLVRAIMKATNLLFDGWIYGLLVAFLLFEQNWRFLLAGGVGVVAAFAFYYVSKPQLSRVRPCEFAASPAVHSRCLDRYSFPSGHCMTLTVLSVLLAWQHHGLIPILVVVLLLLCWARMAAAHHYPSDLVAGIAIGLVVGVPVARWLL
jgi:undecaprenyl-diphosphatase